MRHVPVLLQEVVESLCLKPNMKIVDCTLGDAGHSDAILEKLGSTGKLLAIDADPEAVLRAKQFLYKYENQVVFVRENFSHLQKIAEDHKFSPVQGILIDLGWSTPQFAERGRGFSFQEDEPLDMRYSGNAESGKITAAELLEEKSESELEYIFRMFGEENLSKDIARAIVLERKNKKIETTGQFVEIILRVYREKLKSTKEVPWIGGLHPATKVFQALRIAVNEELGVLEEVLPQAIEILHSGGRLAVITFHSLEDRIVKHYFKSQENKSLRIITKKPIVCGKAEYDSNPPSRSAKLRVIEKI